MIHAIMCFRNDKAVQYELSNITKMHNHFNYSIAEKKDYPEIQH